MKPLERTLRTQLERTVREARDIAETAAKIALEQLGVGETAPFAHLSESERELRRKLRVHGRQLGDVLNRKTERTMDRLIDEVAYEHWHRMLFARFLGENNLLMYFDPTCPVPVTLEECEDLAAKEGAKNGWELAARFAANMLPQIFRSNSPVFQLFLPPEYQQKLEQLIDKLPIEVFTASDSLGWVYQFWQAKKKDEVNASGVKIGAHELPAVTQLFTEPYMVSFLLDNSLGAWWATRNLTDNDLIKATGEEELRAKAALPGVSLDYLRFMKKEDNLWQTAAGTFDDWPEHLGEFKVLDPCCGSGHFLVAAFMMLVPMRMEMEKLSAKDAVDAVLRDNLHGLEIDQRCVELAAFALALAAWRYPGAGGYRKLPELNVACSGLVISSKKEDWLALSDYNSLLRYSLEELYEQFKNASILGSLINPKIGVNRVSLFKLKWEEVGPLLNRALEGEKDDERAEMGVVAQGIAKSAHLLSDKYHLVITNVPYLTRQKQNEYLREFANRNYNESKNDLANMFLDRCLQFSIEGGVSQVVMPQNWLFLPGYKNQRISLLKKATWNLLAKLGPGAFETISGEVVNVILLTLSRRVPEEQFNLIGVETSSASSIQIKAKNLKDQTLVQRPQKFFKDFLDSRIFLSDIVKGNLLSEYAYSRTGTRTADNPLFLICFWEVNDKTDIWTYEQTSVNQMLDFGGRHYFIRWEKGNGLIAQYRKVGLASIQGQDAWGKKGACLRLVGNLPATIYTGQIFDMNTGVVWPKKDEYLLPILAYCLSNEYSNEVRKIDQQLKLTTATLLKIPFNLEHWTNVAQEKYPNGLPKPYSDDPTQWVFHGHPCGSVVWDEIKKCTIYGQLRTDETVLQVAVAHLLGYRWPAELDNTMELSNESHAWVAKSEALHSHVDKGSIICIPSVRGEMKAEDRLESLLSAAYEGEWSSSKKSELLAKADHSSKTLESWLREKFFTQHCKLFYDRPFIWHIWDGLSDGFAALVNYHKLDTKLLETLIYTYLGDWIGRQKQEKANGMDGAEEKLAAAEGLKKRLELILEGEEPYDIFVRWKPLEKQPIGWNPDLNDGVRLNIRPFMSVPDVGKKGAGVLRDRPNINWGKDRGKDVESAPWYHLFKGERINDCHLSLAEKYAALKNSSSIHPGGK